MIQLSRSALTASTALQEAAVRLSGLPDVEASEYANSDAVASAWQSMRADMVAAQHRKCGWCEKFFDDREIEMDHIRPKNEAKYWWLAFETRNILASCRSCNNAKRDKWPLASSTSRRLRPREVPWVVVEPAMIVDPTVEDPRDHLDYRFLGGEWRVVGITDRGAETVRSLELDRDHLRKNMTHYAQHFLDPLVKEIQAALNVADRPLYDAAVLRFVQLAQATHQWAAFCSAVLSKGLKGEYRP